MLRVNFEKMTDQGTQQLGSISWDGTQVYFEGGPMMQEMLEGAVLAEVNGSLTTVRFAQSPELFLRGLPSKYRGSRLSAYLSQG